MTKENEIMQAAKQVCEEKNISLESVIETIEAALAVAYRKDFGQLNENIKAEFDVVTAQARVFDVKTVVPDEKAALTEKIKEERKKEREAVEAGGQQPVTTAEEARATATDPTDEEKEKVELFNPKSEITLTDAKKIKKGSKVDDVIKTELFPSSAYGRMAAQTAKQVIIQRLREAERENVYKEFKGKEGEIINGTIQRQEGKMVLVDLGPTTALLPPAEQIPGERITPGQRSKFFVISVNITSKGPEIILSRGHADMVKKLFSLEVPEVGSGAVEIRSIAREPGSRTKVAVYTEQKNIDPVGSCVGQRGSRVQTVISEIGGEKIDIIEWSDDPVKFISNALSPAKIISVRTHPDDKTAIVEVREDQLSLAIGKAGQNVRLSAKLTGWKIDIVGETKPPIEIAKEPPVDEAQDSQGEPAEEKEAASENKTPPEIDADAQAKTEAAPVVEGPDQAASAKPGK